MVDDRKYDRWCDAWYMVWNEVMSYDMKYDSRYMLNTIYYMVKPIWYNITHLYRRYIVFDVMQDMRWNDNEMIYVYIYTYIWRTYELKLHEIILSDTWCLMYVKCRNGTHDTMFELQLAKWYFISKDMMWYEMIGIWNNRIWFDIIFDRYVTHGVWHQIRYDVDW